MYLADLHVHTRNSDCSETAEEILIRARQLGMTHIAFTDHDTTAMAREHCLLAAAYGINALPAVELSAIDGKTGTKVHILGYGYTSTQHIEDIGRQTLQKRDANSRKQIEVLVSLGYQIDVEEVKKLSYDCIYKQHILDYLCQTGQSETIFGHIYRDILKNGGPGDFDIRYPEAVDAVRAVKADGGLAVLAHPGQQNNFYLLPDLIQAGLDGIECFHPAHGPEQIRQVQDCAQEYGLFMTGGSDYHGRYAQQKSQLLQFPAHPSSEILWNSVSSCR